MQMEPFALDQEFRHQIISPLIALSDKFAAFGIFGCSALVVTSAGI
jgi:hypothetical protein